MKRLGHLLFLGGCAFLGGHAALSLAPRLQGPASAQLQIPPAVAPLAAPGSDVLRLGDRFEAVARAVAPTVVYVEAVKPARPAATPGSKSNPQEESGSGVLIRMENVRSVLVLTNNHVVAQAAPEQITVNFADGRLFHPGRVWADPESDVAILRLDAVENMPAAVLGDSDTARVGQWCWRSAVRSA
jgi:S1-C subfamily serine protease